MGHFQNDLFSENQKDPFSGQNEKIPFSALYIKEKKENDLISLLSRLL